MRVRMSWTDRLVDRLLEDPTPSGAWGYRSGTSPCAEPTSLACLALSARGVEPKTWGKGLAWLATVQQEDGSVPVSSGIPGPAWSTGLAVLAWLQAGGQEEGRYAAHIKKATGWLLATRGIRLSPNTEVYGHDVTLQGWPWVKDMHSWVEPTSYAILALRAVGQAGHPRVREGARVLLDRALPDGGWNYGNKRILANTLRPFPATTGIALSALAGEPSGPATGRSITYLTQVLQGVRTPLTVGWGLIALTAWNARPAAADDWLARSAARAADGQPNTLHDALLLLAGLERCPLAPATPRKTHG